ncbi:DegV family protein with EDD domain [Arthrobacter silviterrae]|uniref:DegV family protein n=1 Tax=Arthrobacter silviterrae TaxID=2026658 RepID=A0ABX0D751_9MICC|nr:MULTISPECIES: DegV family protein [Arthrobacter]MCU6478757.1 DegV family protein [Arthrobacter sp. A2-55]MDQ0276281.1 DegV family protein with EDD domain [Arthrobacter silviterrae]NGN82538.1 DegV family protein [Arthrobacter silviterrae]
MSTDKVAGGGWLRSQAARLRPKPAVPGRAGPRVRVAVVTDSASALPHDWVELHGGGGRLTVVPMPVIIGANVFSDDDSELEAAMSLALASGTAVSTSRPSPGQFDKAYQGAVDAGFDAVLSIHISGKLSGTLDAAQLAADRSGIPVMVLDSATVGLAQGVGVQAAVAAAAAGAAVDQVMAAAQEAIATAAVYFYVPSLEQLRRGGRISLASSWVGTVLDIKPLLGIRDGAVVPLEKVRSAGKAVARLERLTLDDLAARAPGTARVGLHHFGNEDQARALGESLQAERPGLAAPVLTRLPAVLAAHAGLGALVVVVSGEMGPPQVQPGS